MFPFLSFDNRLSLCVYGGCCSFPNYAVVLIVVNKTNGFFIIINII
jgi:hypothetical protein